jgi:hypothetical protein
MAMKKLFGLFLLALAFLAPDLAQAATRFAVCTTACTWDNTSTAMWCATDTGCTGASAPVAGDIVTFNGNTCVGGTTCTITTFAGTISAQQIVWGACTASTTGCIIDASVNNTNFTLSATGGSTGTFNGSGTGTRKWLAGTGTYSITDTSASPLFTMATTTNDQGSVFSGATWTLSGTTTNARSFAGGGFSFGPVTFNTNTSRGSIAITGANTWASLTINAPQFITMPNSTTQTVTGALTLTGSSSSSNVYFGSNSFDLVATISLGTAGTATWVALRSITTSGASGLTASNCFDLGRLTLANGGACNTPSGGGGGGRIIGG